MATTATTPVTDPRTTSPIATEPPMTATIAPTNTTTPAAAAVSTIATGTTQAGALRRTAWAVRSEWIKFWTVRSTSVTLIAASLVTIAFGMIFSAVADSGEAAGPAAFLTNPVDVALGGIGLAEMVIGVVGVLVVAGEYSTGLIRTTFAAVGSRTRVILSKAAVVGAAVFAIGTAGTVGAIVLGQAVYAGNEATVALVEVLDVVFGTGVYLTGIALIGIALGFILRSTAGGIGTLVGGVFIGPNLLNLLPDSITDVFLKYLPSEAGSAMMSQVSTPDQLSTGAAYGVFAAWVIGLLGVAAILVQRRDA